MDGCVDSKRRCPLWLFVAAVTLFFAVTVVFAEFWGTPLNGWYSVAVTGCQYLAVAVCSAGVIAVLSGWRVLFAVVFPLFYMFCGVMCYYRITTGTHLTGISIELAMINGADMWATMISTGVVVVAVLCLFAGAVCAYIRVVYVKTTRVWQCGCVVAGLIVVLVPTVFVHRLEAPVGARLPFSIFYAVRDFLAEREAVAEVRTTYDGVDVLCDSVAPPDVVFVLGESLRADHLPMNGYARNTMPCLSGEANLVSFGRLYSEYTFTDRSVPHILTEAVDGEEDGAYTNQSFITLFGRAGYKTAWFANQELTRSYAYFAHEADTLVYCNAARTVYDYGEWLDRDMLGPFGRWLGGDSVPRLAVLHAIGSHWWYRSHYTRAHAVYSPEVTHKDVGGLSREAMINSYDNTVIATDEFLHGLIDGLRGRNAVLIYVSDHGEALGEDGVFLHAGDVDALHRPAMMVWYSDIYRQHFADNVRMLREMAGDSLGTTDVFGLTVRLGRLNVPQGKRL